MDLSEPFGAIVRDELWRVLCPVSPVIDKYRNILACVYGVGSLCRVKG